MVDFVSSWRKFGEQRGRFTTKLPPTKPTKLNQPTTNPSHLSKEKIRKVKTPETNYYNTIIPLHTLDIGDVCLAISFTKKIIPWLLKSPGVELRCWSCMPTSSYAVLLKEPGGGIIPSMSVSSSSSDDGFQSMLNFYEKLTPPPNQRSFIAGWKEMGKYVETLDNYICAQLHKNTNPNGR